MDIFHLRLSKKASAIISFIGLILIAYADSITGTELSMSAFYLLPISLIALNVSESMGIFIAIVSALVESNIHILRGVSYHSNILIHSWNTGILMVIYILIAMLVSSLNNAYAREKEKARHDYLTGLGNWQSFTEKAEREIARAKRFNTVLSIVYIDCDNFKTLNDTLGHTMGDNVLKEIASILQKNVRKTDVAARLGGDEFVILFTDTTADKSQMAITNISSHLLNRMKSFNWDVTFSIGVATFMNPPDSIETMVKKADMVMYDAKNNGGNAIKQVVDEG